MKNSDPRYAITVTKTSRGDRYHATDTETGINATSRESASAALKLLKQSIQDLTKRKL